MHIKTKKETLYRDVHSKALIVKDDKARAEFRRQKEEKEKIDSEINTLKSEISEIKNMILQLLNKG